MNRLALPAVFLVSVALGGCGEAPPEQGDILRPVRAIKVGDVGRFTQRTFPGRAKATQEVDLSFRVAGPLVSRPVNVGDVLKAGDTVARIDPRDFEVNVRNVQGQLDRAKSALRFAEEDFVRVSNARQQDPGAISESNVDRKRRERDGARAEVSSLEAALDAAEDALSYTHLKAPFDGTVVATYVENYEDVVAREPIIRLLDTSKIEMVVNIPENLISYAPYVTDISVTFDAFADRPLAGTIKEIGTEASQTTRTYPVTLIMDQPEDITILPGMAGRARGRPPADLLERLGEGGLNIPVSAVFSPEGSQQSYVWIIEEESGEGAGTAIRREVTTGQLTDQGIRILKGVEPGEWIATAGVNSLREGQRVRLPVEPEA